MLISFTQMYLTWIANLNNKCCVRKGLVVDLYFLRWKRWNGDKTDS